MMLTTDLQRSLAVSHLYDEVLASSDSIFSVSVVNKNGRVTECKSCNDRIIKNMTKHETEVFFMQKSLQASMSMELDDSLGPLDFIIIQRETLLELIFPYSQGLLVIVSTLNVVPRYLAKKISFELRNFNYLLQSAQSSKNISHEPSSEA